MDSESCLLSGAARTYFAVWTGLNFHPGSGRLTNGGRLRFRHNAMGRPLPLIAVPLAARDSKAAACFPFWPFHQARRYGDNLHAHPFQPTVIQSCQSACGSSGRFRTEE